MSYQNQVLGTIVSSVLNYDQFCSVINERPAIDNTRSSYVPCDGRSIVGSNLEKLTRVSPSQPDPRNHIATSPDLRGRFVRGLNQFYNTGEPALDISTADPDGINRTICTYQGDLLANHIHNYTDRQEGVGNQADSGDDIGLSKVENKTTTNNLGGGAETRPKNIATYFYIKVN